MTALTNTSHEALRLAVDSHFDPVAGTPYWVERARELGLDAQRDLRSLDDLARLGPFERNALLERPLRDFVPRRLWRDAPAFVLAETGATTGRPVRAVYSRDEFEQAFGAPFAAAAHARRFPRNRTWLFVGPSGPHVIGQAARLLARRMGSLEPFTVDLDPRWARAQEPDSLGARLYADHVVSQALDVWSREPIDVLFTTPPLARALAEALAPAARARLRGLHLGGMAVSAADLADLGAAFGSAVVLPGYGNSLFGLLPAPREGLDYVPLAGRLIARVCRNGRLDEPVAVGERGRVVLSRLDVTFLIPNHVERDEAELCAVPARLQRLGFAATGIRDPQPVVAEQAQRGLY